MSCAGSQGGVVSLSVDGMLKASAARNRATACDACGLNTLGACCFANDVGLLDDVGIDSRALSADDIQAVMSQGLTAAVPEPNRWALWLVGLAALGLRRQRWRQPAMPA